MTHTDIPRRGTKVRIPANLTTDPKNRQGQTGRIAAFNLSTNAHEQIVDTVVVVFSDGLHGTYKLDAVEFPARFTVVGMRAGFAEDNLRVEKEFTKEEVEEWLSINEHYYNRTVIYDHQTGKDVTNQF